MRGRKKKQRIPKIYGRGLCDGSHKSHATFIQRQFKYWITKHKDRIPWLGPKKTLKDFPLLTKWFMGLKSTYRSQRVIRLAFIDNYGYVDDRKCLKGLVENNPSMHAFEKLFQEVGIVEINRQRALNREILGFIHPATFRCYFTKQTHPKVELRNHSRQLNLKGKKLKLSIRKLKNFWMELKMEREVVEEGMNAQEQEQSESERCPQNVEVYEQQSLIVANNPEEELIDTFLADWESEERAQIKRKDINKTNEKIEKPQK